MTDEVRPAPARSDGIMARLRDHLHAPGRRYPWPLELGIAALAITSAILLRMAIEQVVGGVAPFVLTFPATIAATLLIGARAGILTAVGCQLLTIQYVFPNWTAQHGGTPADVANLLVTSASLAVMIWATAGFRRMSGRLRLQCEREVETLSLLIGEMDHRTKNNFQLAAALLLRQARDAGDAATVRELDRAATRLGSIASVYRNLGLVSDRSGEVMLDDYLADIIALLRQGYLPPGVDLRFTGAPIRVSAQVAMMIGLIVNEWVTNAVKYAFGEEGGSIVVDLQRSGGNATVTVADDGDTVSPPAAAGGGSRLIAGLAKAIDATLAVDRERGTRCRLTVPARRS